MYGYRLSRWAHRKYQKSPKPILNSWMFISRARHLFYDSLSIFPLNFIEFVFTPLGEQKIQVVVFLGKLLLYGDRFVPLTHQAHID